MAAEAQRTNREELTADEPKATPRGDEARPPASAKSSDSGERIRQLFVQAVSHERARKFDDAVRAYRQVLAIDADHAEACNNLGRVLQAQGKTKDASAYYARSLELMPQLLEQYSGICATLFSLLPRLAEALRRQAAAWPQRLSLDDLLDDNFEAVAANPLFLHLLQSTTVRDVGLERLLTAMRHSLLNTAAAGSPVANHLVSFTCALAKQCFINEYVFAVTPQENEQVSLLRDAIANALASRAAIEPMQLAAVAMYLPLHAIPSFSALLERQWAPAIDDLLNQQVRDHLRERELRDSILRLTAIEDEVSQRVRQQYEENPYPRWVRAAGQVVPASINRYLREQFPTSAFTPINKESLRPPRRRLRNRPGRNCIRAKISGCACARSRPQSDEFVLRQTPHARRCGVAYRIRTGRHT